MAQASRTASRHPGWAAAAAFLAALAGPAWADTAAKPILHDPPKYPDSARANDAEGWVELEFVVGTDGKPKDISVANAEPPKTFERSAVAAIRDWTFQPATRADGPVESHVKIRFDFKP